MPKKNDPYKLASSRLAHYYEGYHLWRFISIVSTTIGLLLGISLASDLTFRQPIDHFFALGPDGEITPIQPLSNPVKSDAKIRTWAHEAVVECTTYGHHNYKWQLERHCRTYFTDETFGSFLTAFNNPANQLKDRIVKDRQISSAVLRETPTIAEKSKPEAPVAFWKLVVPITRTFQKGRETKTIRQKIYLTIKRVPTTERLAGIGITQWRSRNE